VKWHFLPDLSGAGEWRGGSGMAWEVLNLGTDVNAATGSSDGDLTQPPGAGGGQAGPLSHMYIRRGEERTHAQSHRMVKVAHGDVLGKVSGGGGGVGDPAKRDPQAVLDDVRNEFVSPTAAHDVYKVVIDLDKMIVDEVATRALRASNGAAATGSSDVSTVPHG
jgi:N-methylhydantoinase B